MKLLLPTLLLAALLTPALAADPSAAAPAPDTQPLIIPDGTHSLIPPLQLNPPPIVFPLPPNLLEPRIGDDWPIDALRNAPLSNMSPEARRELLLEMHLRQGLNDTMPRIDLAPWLPALQAQLQDQPPVLLAAAPAHLEKAPYLGIATSPITDPALRDQLKLQPGFGLIIDSVEKDSPAEAAGLKTHDILTQLDDQKLINPQQLAVLIHALHPGDTIVLTTIHEGKTTPLTAKLSEKELPALNLTANLTNDPSGSSTYGVSGPFITPSVPPSPNPPPALPILPNMEIHATHGNFSSSTSSTTDSNGRKIITLSLRDPAGIATLTSINGQKRLVAKDPTDKPLFDGPINTPEQRQSIPPNLLPKLQALESQLPNP